MYPETEELLRDLKKREQKRAVIVLGVIDKITPFPELIHKEAVYPFIRVGRLYGECGESEEKGEKKD
jgi:hypothetical protein